MLTIEIVLGPYLEFDSRARCLQLALLIQDLPGDAKIQNVDGMALISQSAGIVGRLQVTMDKAAFMQIGARFETLHTAAETRAQAEDLVLLSCLKVTDI